MKKKLIQTINNSLRVRSLKTEYGLVLEVGVAANIKKQSQQGWFQKKQLGYSKEADRTRKVLIIN